MAYLRWSWSPWYAYSHIDGGDGDGALLVAWHERGAYVSATAGQLRIAGCEHQPERLRAWMERLPGIDPAAIQDVGVLAPAVDQFLFDVFNAGKIPMPPDVARRFGELEGLIDGALRKPPGAQADDESEGPPALLGWIAERSAIGRKYPPPRVPQAIRDLMQTRALRALAGQSVSPEQDAAERSRIAAAYGTWPPV